MKLNTWSMKNLQEQIDMFNIGWEITCPFGHT